MAADTVELVVRLPADLHQALKARADVEDRSMAATIRLALRQYVAGAGPQATPQVLWEGPAEELDAVQAAGTQVALGVAPTDSVRVIAAPTGDPATNRDETASNLTVDGG